MPGTVDSPDDVASVDPIATAPPPVPTRIVRPEDIAVNNTNRSSIAHSIARGGARAMGDMDQFASNIARIVGADKISKATGDEAKRREQELSDDEKTGGGARTTGQKIAEGAVGGIGSAIPYLATEGPLGAGAMAAVQNLHKGPAEAIKSGIMAAVGAKVLGALGNKAASLINTIPEARAIPDVVKRALAGGTATGAMALGTGSDPIDATSQAITGSVMGATQGKQARESKNAKLSARPQIDNVKSGFGFTTAPPRSPSQSKALSVRTPPGALTSAAPIEVNYQGGLQPASNFTANPPQGFTINNEGTPIPPSLLSGAVQATPPYQQPAADVQPQKQLAAPVAGTGLGVVPIPESPSKEVVPAGPLNADRTGKELQPASNFEANKSQNFTMPEDEAPAVVKQLAGEVQKLGFTTASGMQGAAPKETVKEEPAAKSSAPSEPDPNAPRPGEAERAWQPGDPIPASNVPVRIATGDISADPSRFQYKMDAIGKGGTTDEFRGVKKWDNDAAGRLLVWHDPADGKTYVVNGHHRLEMAQRLGAPDLTATFIDAPNATEARARGALTNIKDNKGTSVDAAKVFRDYGFTPEEMEQAGINPASKISREGMSLSGLSDQLFSRVVNGELLPSHGAVIGDLLRGDHVSQKEVVDYLKRKDKQGTRYNTAQIESIIKTVLRTNAATGGETVNRDINQPGLFGEDTIDKNFIGERAQIEDEIRTKLRGDKKLFGLVGKEGVANKLEGAGNSINTSGNRQLSSEASQVLEYYDKLVDKSGPVDEALISAAKDVAKGSTVPEAAEKAYGKVREEVARLLGGRAASEKGK